MEGVKLPADYYLQDVLTVAPGLIGKRLVRVYPSGEVSKYTITETEAYRGMEDKACHVSKGRTARTEIMFQTGGVLYMYLIYGMYWMMNVVTSVKDEPQAVLIRGIQDVSGPGRLTKRLEIDRTFNGEDLSSSERIWIEDPGSDSKYTTHPRIGIDYAGAYWKEQPWRFLMS